MIQHNFVTNAEVNSESSRVVADVGAFGTLPRARFWQLRVKFCRKVSVREMSVQVSVSGEGLVANLARSFHFLVESIFGHVLQQVERHLVGHAVVECDVEAIFLRHLAILCRTPKWSSLGYVR